MVGKCNLIFLLFNMRAFNFTQNLEHNPSFEVVDLSD